MYLTYIIRTRNEYGQDASEKKVQNVMYYTNDWAHKPSRFATIIAVQWTQHLCAEDDG